MAFRVGMNVKLRSGGPKMTIREISADTVRCSWFDKATLREADFPEDMLEDADFFEKFLNRMKQSEPHASASQDA
jgi:uncharacterized protein YodC (DUF2158 family)